MTHKNILSCLLVSLIILFSGCAHKIAKPIDEAIVENPQLNIVRNQADDYLQQRVRWGGVIAGVYNEENTTLIEIVSRPLDRKGRPIESDLTDGRFAARLSGFLDPVVYAKGREITVVGSIAGMEKRAIDSYQYNYVVVRADTYKLWQPEVEIPYYYEPYWYGTWYPYYRWPYYYPRWY